ncbi:MAG: TetR/AcrR family transcriptional regulator [Alphaproteobacteria bacterium]
MAMTEEGSDGRARLVDAALACLAEHGHQGATVRRIAERAGVTAGLVRHHFDGKDALLVEAYRQINRQALDRMTGLSLDRTESPERTLDRAVRAFFPDNLNDPGQMRIMVAFWGLVLTKPEIAAVQREMVTAFQIFFTDLIQTITGPRGDAADIAIGLIALADGLWLECCMNPQRVSPEQAIDSVVEFALARIGS